jgi:hypothetical protein
MTTDRAKRLMLVSDEPSTVESLWTAEDVARYLQIPKKSVYARFGYLALRLGSHTCRWRRGDIETALTGVKA